MAIGLRTYGPLAAAARSGTRGAVVAVAGENTYGVVVVSVVVAVAAAAATVVAVSVAGAAVDDADACAGDGVGDGDGDSANVDADVGVDARVGLPVFGLILYVLLMAPHVFNMLGMFVMIVLTLPTGGCDDHYDDGADYDQMHAWHGMFIMFVLLFMLV